MTKDSSHMHWRDISALSLIKQMFHEIKDDYELG